MDAAITYEDARPVMHVRGDLGHRDAPAFAKLVGTMVASGDPAEIVIDLGALNYLDEHGLAILLAARSFCERKHVGLVLVPGGAQVQRKFEATGTKAIFRFRSGGGA